MWSGRFCEFFRIINERSPAIRALIEDGSGVTAIEYALIAALIAVAAIAAMQVLGTSISSTFSSIANSL